MDGLSDEIHRAESCIERYARFYHAQEADCPVDFKLLMLVNGWHNPFIALNELLRRIYDNEMLMKRERKRTGIKPVYKSRYRELEGLVEDNELRKQDGEMETDNS